MTEPKQAKTASEICSIKVMFPAESDEQAISCKKKITEAMSDMPDAQIHFGMVNIPAGISKNADRSG